MTLCISASKLGMTFAALLMASLPAHAWTDLPERPLCNPMAQRVEAQTITGPAAYRFLGTVVSQNTPDYWQPQNGQERPLCLVERFAAGQVRGDYQVTIAHAGFLKAVQTVLYEITASGTPDRSFHVLYSPALDFMSGEHLAFTLVESDVDTGTLNIYAMYHSAPSYAQVRKLIENILTGDAAPTLSARWPEDGNDPTLTSTP